MIVHTSTDDDDCLDEQEVCRQLTSDDERNSAAYRTAKPNRNGNLHERMKWVLAELNATDDCFHPLSFLESEVRFYKPLEPPFASRYPAVPEDDEEDECDCDEDDDCDCDDDEDEDDCGDFDCDCDDDDCDCFDEDEDDWYGDIVGFGEERYDDNSDDDSNWDAYLDEDG